ncbi:MAG TPA: hypothetical protein VFT29_13595 [Gemmatimonadaceae bacterium]|nr:hypothetical protein [Gemmatimonadaceae bacterium]
MEIDNSLGETHALLGLYHKQLAYDWREVEREMARALELSPASPVVRERYAFNVLMPHARLEEAAAELGLALVWDPQSVGLRSHLGAVLLLSVATTASWSRCGGSWSSNPPRIGVMR